MTALTIVAIALGCSSPEEKVAQHRASANVYYESEQWNEAKIEFINVLQGAPEDADSHYKMAQVLFQLREYAEGLGELRDSVRLDPDNTEWRLELARFLAAARSYASAREHVDVVLSAEPENVTALLVRAGLKSVDNDLDGMLSDIDAALEIDPQLEGALAMKSQALARSGDMAGAEEHWRRLLGVAPTSTNYLTLARLLAGSERWDEAFAVSDEAIKAADGEDERVAAQLTLANLYLTRGDTASAQRVLEAAREQDPSNAQIVLTLARLHFDSGEPEHAEALLLEHVEQRPDSSEALLVLADYYRASGRPELAIDAVDRALAVDPDSEPAQLRRAEYLHARAEGDDGLRGEAWEIVEAVLANDPESVQGQFVAGKFQLAEGRAEEAATSLRRVLDQQASATSHVLLGEAYKRLEQPDLARREFQRALQLDARNAQARLSLAALYLQTGEFDSAEREARAATAAHPNDSQAKLLLANTLIRVERREEALESVEPLGQGESLSPSRRLELARIRDRAGDPRGAQQIMIGLMDSPGLREQTQAEVVSSDLRERKPEQAIARLDTWISEEPERPDLYVLRGRARLTLTADGVLTQPTEAEADLEAAIAKGAPGIQAHLLLAGLYLRTNAAETALQTLLEAGKIAPEDPRVPAQQGAIYERLGRTAEAREAYELVMRLDQDQPIVKNNLAWLLASAEEPSEADLARAMQLAQSAADELPNSPSVSDTLGWVMLRKNIPLAAIPLFQEALAALPGGHPLRPTVRYHLAQAYARSGETDRGIAELKGILERDPGNSEARVSLAALYLQVGEDELAAKEARGVLSATPDDTRSTLVLGTALTRLGRGAQALEALEPVGLGADLSPKARLDLGRVRRQAGDSLGAREIFDELLDQPDLRGQAQAELVNSDLRDAEPKTALVRLDGWIAPEPERADLYLLRGRVRLGLESDGELEQPSEAEADLKAAIEKGSPGIQAYLLLTSLYLQTAATDAALQTLKAARRIAPHDARVPFQLATTYERLGRTDEAKDEYEAALRLDQDQPVVKNNLAWLLASGGDPSEADLDRAMQLARSAEDALPNDPSVSDTLGWVMLKKSSPSEAIPLFQEAIAALPEADPLRGTVRYHLAQAYARTGETDLAISELTRALAEVRQFAEREATEEMLRQLRDS